MEKMAEILTSEFFWGIVVGLVLSLIGGWNQARITTNDTDRRMKNIVRNFSVDIIRNLQKVVKEMDGTRDKASAIYGEYLGLIDAELNVYGRNREHLIQLPTDLRDEVRTFLTDIALHKVAVASNLDHFYQRSNMARDILVQGRGPEAQRLEAQADTHLADAHKSADKLMTVANTGTSIIAKLVALKI